MPDHAGEKSKDAAQLAAKAEISAPTTRWYRSWSFRVALISAIGLFAMLTFLVETTPSFPLDLQITRAIQSIDSALFEGLMRLVSWPGFLPQSVFIAVLLPFLLYIYGLHWESVTSLLTAIISGVTNELVKTLIQRPRPTIDLVVVIEVLKSYGYPSGHVMFYVSFFGFIWYLAYTMLKPSLIRSLLLVFLGSILLLVGVSRIYLGQHWASDVLGAYLLGGLILAGIILFYQWGKKRFFLRQPVAPHDSSARSSDD